MRKLKVTILSDKDDHVDFLTEVIKNENDLFYCLNPDLTRLKIEENITFPNIIIVDYDLIFNDNILKSLENLNIPILILMNKCFHQITDFELDILKNVKIFDFAKFPLNERLMLSKIKLFLNIYESNRKNIMEKNDLIKNIWNMINYCNLYFVMFDKDMTIKLCNHHLSKSLGIDDEYSLINKNFLNFVSVEDTFKVKSLYYDMLTNKKPYAEFLFNINTTNSIEEVMWFNCYVNTDVNLISSIGIPKSSKTIDDNIDSLRSYYQEVITQDRIMINALKDMVNENKNKF